LPAVAPSVPTAPSLQYSAKMFIIASVLQANGGQVMLPILRINGMPESRKTRWWVSQKKEVKIN
jgi:hypothetical protein